MKVQKIYCYKTSFDIAADYAIAIQNYTVENATEKKKMYVICDDALLNE